MAINALPQPVTCFLVKMEKGHVPPPCLQPRSLSSPPARAVGANGRVASRITLSCHLIIHPPANPGGAGLSHWPWLHKHHCPSTCGGA